MKSPLTNRFCRDIIAMHKRVMYVRKGGTVMWSQSVEVLNPYEALVKSSAEESKADKE